MEKWGEIPEKREKSAEEIQETMANFSRELFFFNLRTFRKKSGFWEFLFENPINSEIFRFFFTGKSRKLKKNFRKILKKLQKFQKISQI